MSWLLIAIISYLFLALVNIGDKLFLGNFIPNYKAYTSIIGVTGLLVFLIAPWFLFWPGFFVFVISLVAGILFILALLSFFYSLQKGDASRVIPFVGGLVPIFSLIFSVAFLGVALQGKQWLAFGLLILGSVLIVRMPHKTHWWDKLPIIKQIEKKHHLEMLEQIFIAVLSAAIFAGSFVATKYVYTATEFWNGFIWIRLGSFVAVLGLLVFKDNRKALQEAIGKILSKTGILFLGNQGLGAIGFTLQNIAISLGSVALVNAMQGVQYVFVIALAAVAAIKFPKLAEGEKISIAVIVEKLVAVIIIGGGLLVLTIG